MLADSEAEIPKSDFAAFAKHLPEMLRGMIAPYRQAQLAVVLATSPSVPRVETLLRQQLIFSDAQMKDFMDKCHRLPERFLSDKWTSLCASI